MKKKEKLEQVNRLVQKLGLSPQEAVEYFSAKIVESSSVVRECEVAVGVLPGMYVYADGLISAELITGRQVKAIVGYVGGKTVYGVCLKEKSLPWSSDRLEVKASRNMISGKEATAKILAAAKRTGLKAEAAQWCHDYTYDGVTQGEAFLPSLDEQEKLYVNKKAINESLRALNAKELGGWYWSSIEVNGGYVFEFYMERGGKVWGTKDTNNYVRPVIAFEF